MNAITTTLQATNPRARNPWPIAILLFFVVFISSMAAWITIAVRNDMDLVRKDYYEQEILFQKQIDRTQRTATVAAATKLDFDTATSRLSLQLPPDHVLGGASGKLHLYRPSDAKLDREFPFVVTNNSAQAFDLSMLAPGLWKVQLHWQANGEEFFCDQEIVIARH